MILTLGGVFVLLTKQLNKPFCDFSTLLIIKLLPNLPATIGKRELINNTWPGGGYLRNSFKNHIFGGGAVVSGMLATYTCSF